MDPVRKSWNDTLGDFWSLPTAAVASPPSIESDKNFDLNFKDKNLDIFGKKCTSRHKRSSTGHELHICQKLWSPIQKVTETRRPHSLTLRKRYINPLKTENRKSILRSEFRLAKLATLRSGNQSIRVEGLSPISYLRDGQRFWYLIWNNLRWISHDFLNH